VPSDTTWSPAGRDATHHYSTTTLSTFWPKAEHEKLLARWPHLAAEVGATWDEHRRQHERHCVLVTQAGHGVNQTAGDVAGFEDFLRERNVRKPSSDDLFAYPDLRSQPRMTVWPPARTSPCWCGSGRKYKVCCRPHGLGTLD
jgi:hypothetical protein